MDGSETFTLQQFLSVLRRRRWVLVLAALVGIVTAVTLSLRATTQYESTATLLVGPAKSAPISGLNNPDQTLSASTAARLIRTREVANRVKEALGTSLSASELLGRVSTSADLRDGFVYVTARGDNGAEAAQLANSFANQFVAVRSENADARLKLAVAAVERQLRFVPAQSAERDFLVGQLAQLRIAALPIADADVADPALAPSAPSGPNPVRDAVFGFGLGLLFGLALAFALEAFDPRVKASDELQYLVSAPQLAGLPESVFKRQSGFGRKRREPVAVRAARKFPEPFERLRTSLLVFNAERDLKTIVVTSPSDEREGKTTVAANLAISLAKTGMKVCVVDADLRKPRLGRQFGLDPATTGLAEVIHGSPLKSVVHRFAVPGAPSFSGNGNGNGKRAHHGAEITILAAGRKTANPSELLASKGMHDVLDQLEHDHDVVIVDCPPILAASDGMSLLARACGTLLVVRLFHTPRNSVVRAARVIDGARGGLLGIVGTGVPARELREEGYGPWPTTRSSQAARVG